MSKMMKKKKTTVDAVDRTLQLPEHLQHLILSSLPFEDAVRTSVLSKRWKNVWITALTTLEFDNRFFKILVLDEDFNEVDLCPCEKKRFDQEEISAEKEEGLLNFVERTLRIRHSQMVSLEKLVLHLPFYSSTMASFLDECIRYALKCSVKNLDLKFKCGCSRRRYTLPQTVFAAAKSLTNLSVHRCKFESSNLNLCSLKTLNLYSVFLDNLTFQNLIANCPVIEDLSLDYCRDAKGSLKICGIVNPYLVMVKVLHCTFERVEIAAPGLQSFSFNGVKLRHEINVSNWKNMRELSLSYSDITDRWFRDHISHLPFLEKLSLECCNMLESIKIVSCRLKHFAVDCCSNLVKVEIDDPNLSSFYYYNGGKNMISLSTNALALHRVVLSLLYPPNVGNLWYVQLIEFLGKLKNVKVLKFNSDFSEYVIVPKELRNSLLPPLHNFKHLTLKYNKDWSSEEVEEIVDGAVWFSSHPVTCYTSATHKNGVRLKFHQ